MTVDLQLNAEIREGRGRAIIRRLRREEDKIPAVIYGAGKEPTAITLIHKDVLRLLRHEAAYSQILKLHVGGSTERVVLKAIQRHSYKPKVEHIDFMRVSMKEKMTMSVPLHFEGEDSAPGLAEDGVLTKAMNELEIKCLPADLPEFIALDISSLGLGETLHVSDITLPEKIELASPIDEEHNPAVISIQKPKEEVEEEPEATEEEGAEGEAAEGAEGEEAAAEEAKDGDAAAEEGAGDSADKE